ncbi:hypothetical protein V8E54_002867 [Elaphomyces granulatus]
MRLGGVFLRFSVVGVRILQCLASAVILGIFSYFLAVLSDHKMSTAQWIRAVEGLSGAATLYALLGSLFTICLGGIMFFGFVAMVLDVCFIASMIAIAIMARDGARRCWGLVTTPLGTGQASTVVGYGRNGFGIGGDHNFTYIPSLGFVCRLQKAAFAVSIIAIFLFVISLALHVPLFRHNQREKRYGPSPVNNYTSGSGRRPFWRRRANADTTKDIPLGYSNGQGVDAGGEKVDAHGAATSGNGYYGNSTQGDRYPLTNYTV